MIMMSFKLFLLISLSLQSLADETASTDNNNEGDPVLAVTSDNFTQVVEGEPIILVEFYAPWCGHCKALAPEYKVAARELLKHDPPIPLAKIDATSNEDLARKYDIDGYPIMKVFRNGVPYEYEGSRKADGIVDYMKKQARPDWTPPIDHVLTLTQDNFTQYTDNSDIILVEFYAPWCGHCKKLAPQYKKAAELLHKANTGILLAKVDATAETEIAKQFGVNGYPTMKIFRKGGKVSEYNGPRDVKGIATYMIKQAEPAALMLASHKDLSLLLKVDTPVAVGFFTNEESPEFESFMSAANEGREEPLEFKYSLDPSLAEKYKQKMNTIGVFLPRKLQSKYEPSIKTYDGDMTAAPVDMLASLKKLSKPLIGIRNQGNAKSTYSEYPLLVGYTSNEDEEDSFDYWRSKFAPLASKYKDITFAISDEKEFKDELKFIGLGEKLEDIVIALWDNQREKYVYNDEEVTVDGIKQFIEDYKSGDIKPFRRSQPKPTKHTGPTTVVVGSTFDQIVRDPNKDVLIEFYAPWCGHCKALAPKYNSLAKRYKNNDKIVIAKFDATVNDAPSDFEFTGFPTIFFVAAGEGSQPAVYEGGREVDDMAKFLEENAIHSLGKDKDEL
jgi:protein disulfide-isomerase A4